MFFFACDIEHKFKLETFLPWSKENSRKIMKIIKINQFSWENHENIEKKYREKWGFSSIDISWFNGAIKIGLNFIFVWFME